MRMFIAAFLALAALAASPAGAAEEPEAVYAKYHRAAVTRDLNEMLQYAAAAQRDEFSALSAAQKDAAMKMLESTMPRAFALKNKTLAADRGRARLLVSGPGGSVLDAKTETLYGTISMVNERGEWKVAASSWSNNPPVPPPSTATPRAAPAPAAVQKPVAPARSALPVGSLNAAPERKLGIAREPCVYKPVMTAEDMENCK